MQPTLAALRAERSAFAFLAPISKKLFDAADSFLNAFRLMPDCRGCSSILVLVAVLLPITAVRESISFNYRNMDKRNRFL